MGVIIVTFSAVVIRMLIIINGEIKHLTNRSLVRLYTTCIWGTALFTPFIALDIYRYFTICKSHPALSLYIIFLTILIMCLCYVHFTLYESSTAQERLLLQLSRYDLSGREVEIAQFILKGLSNRAIADEASISVKTVETHCGNVYKKTGVTSRPGFFAKIYQN